MRGLIYIYIYIYTSKPIEFAGNLEIKPNGADANS
jgi:hypothetical protein